MSMTLNADVNKGRHSDSIAQSEPLANEPDDDKERWTPRTNA